MYALTQQSYLIDSPGMPGASSHSPNTQHGWAQQPGATHVHAFPTQIHPHDNHRTPAHSPRVRMRWGRLFMLIVAIALVACAIANLLRSSDTPSRPMASGGITRSVNDDSRQLQGTASEVKPPNSDHNTDDQPRPVVKPSQIQTPPSPPTRSTSPEPLASLEQPPRAASSTVAVPATRGGGSSGQRDSRAVRASLRTGASLPYTGAPAWVIGCVGALFLFIGIGVQLRAPAIAHTASQYRRGPLLRPLGLIARTPLVYCHIVRWCGQQTAHGFLGACRQIAARATATPERDFVTGRRVFQPTRGPMGQ